MRKQPSQQPADAFNSLQGRQRPAQRWERERAEPHRGRDGTGAEGTRPSEPTSGIPAHRQALSTESRAGLGNPTASTHRFLHGGGHVGRAELFALPAEEEARGENEEKNDDSAQRRPRGGSRLPFVLHRHRQRGHLHRAGRADNNSLPPLPPVAALGTAHLQAGTRDSALRRPRPGAMLPPGGAMELRRPTAPPCVAAALQRSWGRSQPRLDSAPGRPQRCPRTAAAPWAEAEPRATPSNPAASFWKRRWKRPSSSHLCGGTF